MIIQSIALAVGGLYQNNSISNALVGLITAAEFALPGLIIAILGAIGTKKAKQTDDDAKLIVLNKTLYQTLITVETIKSLLYIVGVISMFVGIIIIAFGRGSGNTNKFTLGIIVSLVGVVLLIVSIILANKAKRIRREILNS